MNHSRLVVLALPLVLLAACVPSFHPLYTEKDLVFEPGLVGVWSEPDKEGTWTFRPHGDKAYSLTVTDANERTSRFLAHLLKIDGKLFLDLYPHSEKQGPGDTTYQDIHYVPAHTFLRVRQVRPALQMAMMNPRWMIDYLKEHPDALQHVMDEDEAGRVLLTARPAELQKFILQHEGAEGFYGDFSNLVWHALPPEKGEDVDAAKDASDSAQRTTPAEEPATDEKPGEASDVAG
ncbi:MAG: hypothetical protein ACOY3P_19260 [Planctomycetota bacterium]